MLKSATCASVLRTRGWKRLVPVDSYPQGCLSNPVGSVRTKKWRPFHNMFRANYVRRLKENDAAEARTAQAEADAASADAGFGGAATRVAEVRPDDPKVMTTPFQAARLIRAFDVFPDSKGKIELTAKLNVDLSRESVRGTCHLPHGLQTDIKVLAFCADDEIAEMLAAGADVAGISEPIRRINQGWLAFDRCLATPSIMPQVMRVAKILGPRRMMPNPKSGTVVQNLKTAIKEAKGGTLLEYRCEGDSEIKATIADAGFSDAKMLENMKFLIQTLLRARPRGASSSAGKATSPLIPTPGMPAGDKAQDAYFLGASLKLSVGPPVPVDPETIMPNSVGYFR